MAKLNNKSPWKLAALSLLGFGLLANCSFPYHQDLFSVASNKLEATSSPLPSLSAAPTSTPSPTPPPSATPTPSGAGTVTVTIPDPAVLTVGFSSQPATLSYPNQVTISATGISGATSYLWELSPAPTAPVSAVDGTTGASVAILGSDLDIGGQYTLTLFVTVGGNLYSGSFVFTVTN